MIKKSMKNNIDTVTTCHIYENVKNTWPQISELLWIAENELKWACDIMWSSISQIENIINKFKWEENALWKISSSEEISWEEKCARVNEVIQEVLNIILNSKETNELVVKKLNETKNGLLESKVRIEQHTKMAFFDELTGSPNRYKYSEDIEKLKQELEDLKINYITYSILDIDFFKKINDTYWHKIGDLVLKTFAYELNNTLQSFNISDNDTLSFYRFWWEEFVIVSTLEKEKIYDIIDSFREIISKKRYKSKLFEWSLCFTFSGWVESTNIINNVDHLYSEADKKLYVAKQKWRNQIVL